MLRGVGITPLGGLTPLKLMVYSRPLTRRLIRIFIYKSCSFIKTKFNCKVLGAKNPEIEAFVSVNIHFTAIFYIQGRNLRTMVEIWRILKGICIVN